MTKPSNLELVEIGIATKNRWQDLRDTLERIAAFGLGEMPILIFDDASDMTCPYDVKAICAGAELRRFDESRGYIVRRNQLAQAMTAKYYLSLDDDSFPLIGSLEAAIAFAESHDNLFCLTFAICNSWISEKRVGQLHTPPYQVKAFTGCAHMVHRERFLALGGYREELVHMGEESEIAVRAFMQGLTCYRFPGLRIYHTEANASRSYQRMDYYGARNTVLWNDWYLPPWYRMVRQARSFVARILLFLKTGRKAHMQGQLAGLQDIRRYKRYRQPMSHKLYAQWMDLPAD